MANKILVKRGTNLSNAGTPAAGELLYKTDTRALYVGDGSTAATSLTAIAGSGGDGDITEVTAGTGLSGGGSSGAVTLNVDAAQTQITSIGTIGTGVWNGTAIASAYLDADTAHLSGTQTFTGVKTFSDGSESLAYTPSNNYLTIHETGASKGSHLRLATDNSDYFITAAGGSNAFSIYDATSASNRFIINSAGAISTGVWQGTDVEVAYGGTGVSTLASNSVLTGTGTSPITAESTLTFDGSNNVLTASGSTTISGESGLTFDGSNNTLNLNGQYNDVTLNGTSNGTLGCWEFVNSGTWGQTRFYVQDANNVAGRLTFDFRGNAGSSKILAGDSQGKVGIGTITPATNLHISSGSAQTDNDGMLKVEQTSTSSGSAATNAGINTKNYHGTSQFLQWEEHGLRIGSRILTNSGTGDVVFTAGADSEKMRIKAGGNVGIGIDSPGYNLHVKSASGSHAEVRIETPSDSSVPALSLNNGNRVYSLGIMSDEDFAIRDGSASWAERLSINTSGHVTIPNTLYCSTIQTDSGNLSLNGGGWGMNFYIDTDSNSADNYTFFSDGSIRHILGGDGNVTFGKVSNPTLSIMNTATGAGSGPTLEFGHDQGGGLRAAAIKTYLTDGSTTNRTSLLRFHHTQQNADVLKLQLGDNYVRQYQKGDTSDYLETMVHDTHAEFHVASGDYIKTSTDSGYALFGPQNTSWNHIYTSAPGHLFDKYVTALDGNFQSYSNVDLSLRRSQGSADRFDITADYSRIIVNNTERFRATTSGATVTGVLQVVGNGEIRTDYGVRFNNGATDFMFYNNTNDNVFYLRDLTNAQMLQTWGTSSTTIHKPVNVTGTLAVTSQINLTNSGSATMVGLKGTNFGYSSSYKALQIGNTIGTYTTAFGYDPSTNASGNFTGDGREIIFRNGAEFMTPNSANNDFHNDILVLKDGKVGISTSAPAQALDVNGHLQVRNGYQYIGDSTSGVLSTGSWAGDLTSNGYERVAGLSHDGGEFVLVEKSGQVAVLVDGDYFAYENNGFWSSNNSTYGNATGFKSNGAAMMMVCQKDGGAASLQSTGDLIVNSGYISGVGSADMQIRRTTNSDDRIVIEASETKIYGDASERIRFGSYGTRSDVVGSAGTPSYSFTNDTDTGWYRRGADQIGFSTGGSERAYITDAGIVSVGNFTTTGNSFFNYGMVVNEGGNDADLRVESVGNEHMLRVDASANKVGIGTGTPGSLLTVYKDGTQVSSPSTSYQIMTVSNSNGGIAIQAGASSDAFISFGDYGQYDAGRIRYHNSTHYMDFCTQGNNPRMTLKNDGKVVINGTDSDGMFRVNSTSSENAVKIYANAARGASRYALMIDDNDTNGRGSVYVENASGTGMKIVTQGSNYLMDLVSNNDGSNPARSCGVRMTSYEGRANGHYHHDVNYGGEWFSGNRYAGNMTNWHVGYRSGTSGDTPDYLSRARIMVDTNGHFHADGDVIAYSSTIGSDIKLKKNVEDIGYGLDDVLKMRAVEFDWKKKREGKHDIGVIAQELEKIIPEVVNEVKTIGEGSENGDTHKVVDYAKLTSVLIKAIQQQQVQIDELKIQIGE